MAKKNKTYNRSNIITNSIKTAKVIHIKKRRKKSHLPSGMLGEKGLSTKKGHDQLVLMLARRIRKLGFLNNEIIFKMQISKYVVTLEF